MREPRPPGPSAAPVASPEGGSLAGLNPGQRAAVLYGLEAPADEDSVRDGGLASESLEEDGLPGPLLVIAGAGSGKTTTLAHRVARILETGGQPERILLLTFTRRAALEMTRRAQQIQAAIQRKNDRTNDRANFGADFGANSGRSARGRIRWSGTFHAVANRLLRMHGESLGLDPAFTVLDRGDSADLMNWMRGELGLARKARRFPKKSTCLAIYSHTVNAQCELEETLETHFPWCAEWGDDLRALYRSYTDEKQRQAVLDFDDLLLYWVHLMREPELACLVQERFDHVLVDEYQDTNALQAEILLGLKPDGRGLTVVGDDAQSIYSFRSADVRNILEFPQAFDPPARVQPLEQSYRATQPLLAASNAVIAQSARRYAKELFSERRSREAPFLVTAEDEQAQVDYVVEQVLAYREAGIPLRRQAVLFRTAHHSDALEVELSRRNLPFVKYGGLRFLEAAHVKDLLCVLRTAENPRDAVAAYRALQLLPGIGPGHARRAFEFLGSRGHQLEALAAHKVPAAAAEDWGPLCALLAEIGRADAPWAGQVERVARWYQPHLERLYDSAVVRAGDLEQLDILSAEYPSRERFLSELTLDPPQKSGDEAGPPHLDEDWLVLSTIHSAKGQEWDAVFVLNAADGAIPSDMAVRDAEQVEEERRLLYVAMTRARDHLHVIHPRRFYVHKQPRRGDRHVLAPRTRFIPDGVAKHFALRAQLREPAEADARTPRTPLAPRRVDVGAKLRDMWS